jgi:hypothetical protein
MKRISRKAQKALRRRTGMDQYDVHLTPPAPIRNFWWTPAVRTGRTTSELRFIAMMTATFVNHNKRQPKPGEVWAMTKHVWDTRWTDEQRYAEARRIIRNQYFTRRIEPPDDIAHEDAYQALPVEAA